MKLKICLKEIGDIGLNLFNSTSDMLETLNTSSTEVNT